MLWNVLDLAGSMQFTSAGIAAFIMLVESLPGEQKFKHAHIRIYVF